MEAGAVPIRIILISRRLCFHQTILKRDITELTRKIYEEQKINPTPGDFSELLKDDFKIIKEVQNDEKIRRMNTKTYKEHIKHSVKIAAFDYLKEKLKTHSKVKHIEYHKFEIQAYMKSPIFSNIDVNMLYSLRSRSADCKMNFKQKYTHTNFLCCLCGVENEDQPHLLACKVLKKHLIRKNIATKEMKYEDIFSEDIRKQKKITTLYMELFQIKKKLENDSQEAPSSSTLELTMDFDLHHCIDNSLSGKQK